MPEKLIVASFSALFKGRTDVWGTITGGCMRSAVKDSNYERHLAGKVSLGIYPLTREGIIYFLSVDIDQPDYETARLVRWEYDRRGYPAYIERSKSMCFHVWTFYVGVEAAKARAMAKTVLAACKLPLNTEIFPKQDFLPPDGVGNYINLPYYGGDGERRVFLDDEGQPMALNDFLASVKKIEGLPEIEQPKIPTPRIFRNGTGPYSGPTPGCIEAALETPATPGSRHATGIRIAGFFLNMKGLPEEAVLDILADWNDRNAPPLDDDKLLDCISDIRGYTWGCEGLKELNAFAEGCWGAACDFYKPEPQPYDGQAKKVDDPGGERELCDYIASEGFLKDYLTYACKLTDAPRIFHLVSAMAIIGASLGNHVHCLGFGNTWVFPHVWLCFVAPSGLFRKSTAMKMAREILVRACPGIALSEDASREQWQLELSERSDRILFVDEFAALLNSWENKYMMGTKAMFTTLYDVSHYTRTTKGDKDSFEITNPSITILAGSTKDWLLDAVKPMDFRSGFLARLLFIVGRVKEPRVVGLRQRDAVVFDHLIERLKRFSRYQGELDFSAVQVGYDHWLAEFEDKWGDHIPPEVVGLISRAGLLVQKLAIIFHIAGTMPEPGKDNPLFKISPASLEKAIFMVEWVIERQKYLIEEEFALTEFDKMRHKVLEILKHRNKEVGRSDLMRACRWSTKDFSQVVDNLVETGDVAAVIVNPEGRGAKKTLYRLSKRGTQHDQLHRA